MIIEMVIFSAAVFGLLVGLLAERVRMERRRPAKARGKVPAPTGLAFGIGEAGDTRFSGTAEDVARLRTVSDSRFAPRRFLSEVWAQRLNDIEELVADLGENWRVIPFVALDQILASSDEAANRAIAGQRVDMLIVTAAHMPVGAIQYRPVADMEEQEALRDALRTEALRRAGVACLQLRPIDGHFALRDALSQLSERRTSAQRPSETLVDAFSRPASQTQNAWQWPSSAERRVAGLRPA